MSDGTAKAAKYAAVGLALLLMVVALPLSLMLLGGGAADSCANDGTAVDVNLGRLPSGSVAGYSGEQLKNAAYILKAGKDLGLGLRDQTIGVMTAMGESSLRVIDYGDAVGPDSRGLFQQRANGAWGSYADRMNPYVSATNFFRALLQVSDRANVEPTIVAHRVQRNADPYHYTKFWDAAVAVVNALRASAGSLAAADVQLPAASGTQTHYPLGPVQPQTQALADGLGHKFGVRDIGGWRAQDPYPDHPSGLAIDLMVYRDRAKGQAIADYARANAEVLGVQYVMWYGHIWNLSRADEGWRVVADRGSPTANHEDHVHITLRGDAQPVNQLPNGGDVATGCPAVGSTGEVNAQGWTAPAIGPISSPYGWRVHPITGVRKLHTGVDIAPGCGKPIYAVNNGVVVSVTHPAAYGNLVTIDHGGGILTRYGHMYDDGVLVHAGEHVAAGQQIAKVGSNGWSTGCHVHLEILLNGSIVNPQTYLAQQGVELR